MRELVPLSAGESFRWTEHDYPSPVARWNYHPEVEIHLIRSGTGSYLIGREIGAFGPGHVAVVGADVPHDWMSDLAPGEVIRNRDCVMQFLPSWIARVTEAIPEMHPVMPWVDETRRGIVYTGRTAVDAARMIEEVGNVEGSARIARFFLLLDLLMSAPVHDRHYVAHDLYSTATDANGRTAVDAGLAYVVQNLAGAIRMSEAARLAHMSEPSFSKYFKKASGLTFSELVRRLRVANACRLLDQTDASIASISASVGYQNLANFNRQFRAETGMTPSGYRTSDVSSRPKIGLASQATATEA
ncbi:AraC family transcriptional regulator [uncultured Microbacterium sp.]|uniref:AraC family transcriptional regulator n=1 Tax=uncultured Microbacterium sp. TaxID=191216 RepID=UPI0028D7C4F9|nr:AraC family transcriptional regulator [uncultured Microbacterium sp.]